MFSRVITMMRYVFVFVAAILSAATMPAAAQDGAAFYKGKTVKFFVSGTPGGGFDSYARMIAPHLAEELGATVVVHSVPGGGGLTLVNSVYKDAGDGLQLALINGNASALAQLVEDSVVRFDLRKFNLLGLVSTSPWIWIATPKSPLQTVADFAKPGVRLAWAGSGQMGGASDGAAITCEALGLNCNIIRGYPGSAQGAFALARGEVDSMYLSDTSARNYVDRGDAKAVVAVSSERSRFFPDLPTVFEALPLTADQKWWFEFRSAIDDLQRILTMPPNVPPAQLAAMREAMRKVLTDPKIVAEGEKTQRYLDYRDATAAGKMIDIVLGSMTPAQKVKVRDVILKE